MISMNEMKRWAMQNRVEKKMKEASVYARTVLAKKKPTVTELNSASKKLYNAHKEFKKVIGKK